MDYVSLGQRIRKQRRARHWTQADLAQEVDISMSFLGHIERGTRKASLETIVSICNALNVSPGYLLENSLSISPRGETDPAKGRYAVREAAQRLYDNLDEWLEAIEDEPTIDAEKEIDE